MILLTYDFYSYIYEYTKDNWEMPSLDENTFPGNIHQELGIECCAGLNNFRTDYKNLGNEPLYILNDFNPSKELQILYSLCALQLKDDFTTFSEYLSSVTLDLHSMRFNPHYSELMQILLSDIYESLINYPEYNAFVWSLNNTYGVSSIRNVTVDSSGLLYRGGILVPCTSYQEYRFNECVDLVEEIKKLKTLNYSDFLIDVKCSDTYEFFDGDLYNRRLLGYGYSRNCCYENLFKISHSYIKRKIKDVVEK